eukprot:1928840-Amphidinium_carterae.2
MGNHCHMNVNRAMKKTASISAHSDLLPCVNVPYTCHAAVSGSCADIPVPHSLLAHDKLQSTSLPRAHAGSQTKSDAAPPYIRTPLRNMSKSPSAFVWRPGAIKCETRQHDVCCNPACTSLLLHTTFVLFCHTVYRPIRVS